MGNRGDSNNNMLTYSPFKQAVYEGDMSGISLNNPGVDYALAKSFLASLKRGMSKEQYPTYQAGNEKPDPNTGYMRTASAMMNKPEYQLQLNGKLNKLLFMAAQKKQAESEFFASMGNDNGASGLAAMAKLQQLNASQPASATGSDSQAMTSLTQIPFIQDVLGIPNEQYWIAELFTKVALPQLHAEQPEVDWIAPFMNLRPAQDVQNLEPNFDSWFFEALRTEVPFIIPREYRMRATIDPYNLYADAAARALREGREAKALLALHNLPSSADIDDPAEANTSGFPASANNTKVQLEALFAAHWKDFRIQIDSCVVGPQTFATYESNFYTNGFAPYQNIENWGLVNLPGFKRPIRCAVSPLMTENLFYFFNQRYAFLGEGPQVTESWAKPEKNSDAGAWRDYNDIVIFNPDRAGFKTGITNTSPAPEEVETIDDARALIAPGDNVLADNIDTT